MLGDLLTAEHKQDLSTQTSSVQDFGWCKIWPKSHLQIQKCDVSSCSEQYCASPCMEIYAEGDKIYEALQHRGLTTEKNNIFCREKKEGHKTMDLCALIDKIAIGHGGRVKLA